MGCTIDTTKAADLEIRSIAIKTSRCFSGLRTKVPFLCPPAIANNGQWCETMKRANRQLAKLAHEPVIDLKAV
jgi:hypothetical protein